MVHLITRRSLLSGSAGLMMASSFATLPLRLEASAAALPYTKLVVDRRTIDVLGKAASVFGIRQADGTPGLTLEAGVRFQVDVVNNAGEDVIIHWHGQKPLYNQDGVADANRPLIANGATQGYNYAATPGTHWMHSHHLMQEQTLMAAPLVVHSADDAKMDVQDVTVMLHDFSFRDPAEILAELTGGKMPAHKMAGMNMTDTKASGGLTGMKMDSMKMDGMTMASDLNDIAYDAYLANDRTLDDPLVFRTERNGKVRLRLINGAASSAFWIDLGQIKGTLIAVDGIPVEPFVGKRFPISMGQRLDVLVDVPTGNSVPVFAQVEGKRERTGFFLAAVGTPVKKISGFAEAASDALDLSLEMKLRSLLVPLVRAADLDLKMAITGSMSPYSWSINNQVWPNVDRPVIKQGQRVAIEMTNETMMAHPMHLHGHHFQVIAINGKKIAGAVRDTVLVPPMGNVKIAFDADNPGRWLVHCHNLYHMATGMMTELVYDGFA